jgi:non-ribosomal peptide synthase protein (TIGR01720 family)
LARYNSDGSINFVGRKDSQVKVRGQRIELGEVEHHLSTHPIVQHAVVLYPARGRLTKRLVAIISLRGNVQPSTGDEVKLAVSMSMEVLSARIRDIRDDISKQLPIFMIPETWVILENLPLTSSRKIHRNAIVQWIHEISESTHLQILDMVAGGPIDVGPLTPTEKSIQMVISHVLGLPIKQVEMSRSFVNIGGDSISAMQVMSRCRAVKIHVTVQDILRSKSITQLALCVKTSLAIGAIEREEEVDTPFPLSPIQRMYFDQAYSKHAAFNQSFTVKVKTPVKLNNLTFAINLLVLHHSMLRARFSVDKNGQWTQLVGADIDGSFQLKSHDVDVPDQINRIAIASQTAIDIEKGPLFAVDLFNINKMGQYLFLTASHLIVDLVSWRILLQDLEEILQNGALVSSKPLSFLTWSKLQTEYSEQHLSPDLALPSFVRTTSNANYWGMSSQSNTYADVANETFKFSPELTKILLNDVHGAMRTDFVDLCISAMLQSFGQIFQDREFPSVFVEGHGRESWDPEIDNSRTVGWFTTVYPVQVKIEPRQSVVETIRRTKDARRLVPQNGWSYFASRFLNAQGRDLLQDSAAEIVFNYEGQYQQLESNESLLQMDSSICKEASQADVGREVRRFALFEVSVVMTDGAAAFCITYNRKMLNIGGIKRWCARYKNTLEEAALLLVDMVPMYTLSDFPLLPLTVFSLQTLVQKTLPQLGWSEIELEDAYPCSPLQQGLLINQAKGSGCYDCQFSWEIVSQSSSATVDLDRLDLAWQNVLQKHSTLRTVFVEGITDGSVYDQIVLKKVHCPITRYFEKDLHMEAFLAQKLSISKQPGRPRHQFSVWQGSHKTVCRLDISHTLSDGGSPATLTRDLTHAYDGKSITSPSPDPVYRSFIAYIQKQPIQSSLEYWKHYLGSAEVCYMPHLIDELELEQRGKQLRTIALTLTESSDSINKFCAENKVTLSNLVQAVWAIVLRCYVGADSVCFGYLTSGRDTPIQGIEEAVGAFINMLVCYTKVHDDTTIRTVMDGIQADFSQSLSHQYCSLGDIQHSLGLSGQQPLFNTGISVQKIGSPDLPKDASVEFRSLGGQDVTEVR